MAWGRKAVAAGRPYRGSWFWSWTVAVPWLLIPCAAWVRRWTSSPWYWN